jgi:hypothetical protein
MQFRARVALLVVLIEVAGFLIMFDVVNDVAERFTHKLRVQALCSRREVVLHREQA